MSWAIGFDARWQRDVGYGVVAYCDHPGCTRTIDRGLSYVCGDEPYGGEHGCGLYFCGEHLSGTRNGVSVCRRGATSAPAYKAKADHPAWIVFKMRHVSWAAWRAEHPDWVEAHRAEVEAIVDALNHTLIDAIPT